MNNNYHFIGIAGSGMFPLAAFIKQLGFNVSGSDTSNSPNLDLLQKLGIKIFNTQSPDNIHQLEPNTTIVVSAAIPPSNKEKIEAEKQQLPIISRGKCLALLANEHPFSIAVCGTHGKGTTAAALSLMLPNASFIIGAPLKDSNQSYYKHPNEKYLILEVDESDKTHLYHTPKCLLINNIEADHLNTYHDLNEIIDSFEQLVLQALSNNAYVLIQLGSHGTNELKKRLSTRLSHPSPHNQNLYYADLNPLNNHAQFSSLHYNTQNTHINFDLIFDKQPIAHINSPLGGTANAQNLLAAASTAYLIEPINHNIQKASQSYNGLADRFDIILSKSKNSRLITNYASHPTAMKYDLIHLRELAPNANIHALFQPYRYTLMNYHLEAITQVLAKYPNFVYLAPFDPCGEHNNNTFNSHILAAKINEINGHAMAFDNWDELEKILTQNLKDNDQIIAFGASKLFNTAKSAFKKLL